MENFEKAFDIAKYITKYLRNELDAAERRELQHWLDEHEDNKALFEKLTSEDYLHQQLINNGQFNVESAFRKFIENRATEKPVISIRKNYGKWWMAAAGFFLLSASLLYVFLVKNNTQMDAEMITQSSQTKSNDVLPGGNKAVLTLADGSVIELDEAANGTLSTQGNMKVIKLPGGKLAYEKGKGQLAEVQYNTVTTPVGGQYELVLSDGSHVWLNAASSITFPTYFAQGNREVQVNGEVYLDVAHDRSRPFIVKADNVNIAVLGTSFNLSAYKNDDEIITTLVEGSVKISDANESVVIEPGEQAQVNHSTNKISVIKDVNLESITAWKNGKFNFQEEDIHAIMRKLERWYGITVTFQSNVTREKFVGVISRDVKLSQILKMLEKTGVVDFTIVGKNVIVK